MASFYEITLCRSDGLLETGARIGFKEKNQPTAAQLDDTPDADGIVDCYRKISDTELKAWDWKRKLGGMLARVLDEKESRSKNYILKEIPDGYTLWEHVKYKSGTADKKGEKGKHSAAIYERQDAYLYGHPQGRKKRYRSPADFFPHALWLATDKEGNPDNCSCKVCSPEEASSEVAKPEVKKESKPILPPASASPPKSNVQVVIPAASPAQSAEQKLDAEPNGKYLYRLGELVWFSKGQAWGLAVIAKRRYTEKAQYLVQPLSHPLHHLSFQIKEEGDIRPWLAWSVPATTHPQIANLNFDQVPWDRVVRGDFGMHDAQVDGSILAAKAIDGSYSLFDRIETPLAVAGETFFRGMFLGAEKIWTGEPVRLKGPTRDDIVILIIQKLIEHITPPSNSTVTFVGDIYKFVQMPMPYKERSQWPTPALPERMTADLRFRNEVADDAKKGVWYEWRLLEPAARRGLSDIKGRWYETRTLLPVLRGAAAYQSELVMGTTSDAGLWMNGRGDTAQNAGQRRKNRRDTLGQSVPADFKVSRGLDGAPADNIFPDLHTENQRPVQVQQQQQANAAQQQQQSKYAENDIDQFMDLDAGQNEFYGSNL